MSSSKRTKHIKAKYFFVTDKVAQGDFVIEHKSTDDMWIDSHTKPKQGTPFRLDRSYVMNCPLVVPDETLDKPLEAIYSSKPKAEQRLQECVGSPRKMRPVPTPMYQRKLAGMASALLKTASRIM